MKLDLFKVKTNDELVDILNEQVIFPVVSRGKVTLLALKESNDGGEPVEAQGEGYCHPHPAGADRGGIVPYWEVVGLRAFYNGEEWGW